MSEPMRGQSNVSGACSVLSSVKQRSNYHRTAATGNIDSRLSSGRRLSQLIVASFFFLSLLLLDLLQSSSEQRPFKLTAFTS